MNTRTLVTFGVLTLAVAAACGTRSDQPSSAPTAVQGIQQDPVALHGTADASSGPLRVLNQRGFGRPTMPAGFQAASPVEPSSYEGEGPRAWLTPDEQSPAPDASDNGSLELPDR